MLQGLGWLELEERRRDLRLALIFKVIHGHVAVAEQDIGLQKAYSKTRANHPYKRRIPKTNTSEFKNFITVRSIDDWNSLSPHVVEASTTDLFKKGLRPPTSAQSV